MFVLSVADLGMGDMGSRPGRHLAGGRQQKKKKIYIYIYIIYIYGHPIDNDKAQLMELRRVIL